jgi:hypothetical protein
MTKTAQSNYKPKKISRDAVLERIKDGTHIPAHEKDVYGNQIPMAKNPRYSNDPMNKGEDVHPEVNSFSNLIDKFEKINAKNNCMRVRFYDWFADYLEKTAQKMRDRAFKITSPCSISLPPQKEKKVESKTLSETVLNTDRLNKDSDSMKLPDEDVKKIVPDLTPDHDNVIAVKNATEIANTMVKAGNSSTTLEITPDTKEKK